MNEKIVPWWDIEEDWTDTGDRVGIWSYSYKGEVIGEDESFFKAQKQAEAWFEGHPEYLSLFAPASYVKFLYRRLAYVPELVDRMNRKHLGGDEW